MFKILLVSFALMLSIQGSAEAVKWEYVTAVENMATMYVDVETVTYPSSGVVQFWNKYTFPPEGFLNPNSKMVEQERKHLYRVTSGRQGCSIQTVVILMDGKTLDSGPVECKYSNIPPDTVAEEFWKFFFNKQMGR